MPRGNNSYLSDNDGAFWRQQSVSAGGQSPIGISEPGSSGVAGSSTGRAEDSYSIQAKEPERPGTARRASVSRSRMGGESQDEDQSESRSQRSSNRGTQARRATVRGTQARRASTTGTARQKKSRRGFAAMSSEQQREIARKGGLTVSRNRRHMADIGRIGGEHSHGGRRAKSRR